VAQSFKQKDVTLWGQPFEVIATVVDKSSLSVEHQLPGAGRKMPGVHHQINKKALIKVGLLSL